MALRWIGGGVGAVLLLSLVQVLPARTAAELLFALMLAAFALVR